LLHLFQPAATAGRSAESRALEIVNHSQANFDSLRPPAEAEDIHIVVFHPWRAE
jgi:hypothetical protein